MTPELLRQIFGLPPLEPTTPEQIKSLEAEGWRVFWANGEALEIYKKAFINRYAIQLQQEGAHYYVADVRPFSGERGYEISLAPVDWRPTFPWEVSAC